MNYIGEHLLPGQIGHFLAVLSLVASLVSTIAYVKVNRTVLYGEKQSWLRFAESVYQFGFVSQIRFHLSWLRFAKSVSLDMPSPATILLWLGSDCRVAKEPGVNTLR